MINEIYNRQILGFAADIPRLQRLAAPDATAMAISRLCGSKVTVDVNMKDGVVTDFGQEVKACALGQAAAAILGEHIIGATPAEVDEARDALYAMLKSGGPAPQGRFSDLAMLEPVKDYAPRHASTLLAFEAAAEALRQATTRTSAAGAA